MTAEFNIEVIENIMQAYPEQEWLAACKKVMPLVDDGSILSAIEILSGGDVVEVGDE